MPLQDALNGAVAGIIVEPVGMADDVRVRVGEAHGRILEQRQDRLEIVRLPEVVRVEL
jgi:hypothetical protein